MLRIVVLLALIAIGLLLWYKVKSAPDKERKKLIFQILAGAFAALMIFMAATGRLNVVYAAIAGIVAFLPRIAHLLKFLPLINKVRQAAAGGKQSSKQSANQSRSAMNKDKAYEVLGLKPGASKQEIITAHKKMMQKNHPDRGGSDYLAAEINTAKDTLLG